MLHLLFDGGYESVDGRQGLLYRQSHLLVLCIDMGGELLHAHLFQMVVERTLLRDSAFLVHDEFSVGVYLVCLHYMILLFLLLVTFLFFCQEIDWRVSGSFLDEEA